LRLLKKIKECKGGLATSFGYMGVVQPPLKAKMGWPKSSTFDLGWLFGLEEVLTSKGPKYFYFFSL